MTRNRPEMTSPLFSCIVPVYNRAHTIQRAVESILRQTYQDFEIIIVDDGSTDKLQSALKTYESNSKIKIIKQNNHGVSHARNRGEEISRGRYLAFLDSDDEWLPHKLETQKELLDKKAYKLVHGEETWKRNGKQINQKNKHQKGGGDQFMPSLEQCLIGPSTTIIERTFFQELGGFREDFPVCEDYDLWLKVTSLTEVGFIEEPIIIKHGGAADQLSTQFKGMDYWRCVSLLWTLENRSLSDDKKKRAFEVLHKKIDIMLGGLRKKDHQDDFIRSEIFKIKKLKEKAGLL